MLNFLHFVEHSRGHKLDPGRLLQQAELGLIKAMAGGLFKCIGHNLFVEADAVEQVDAPFWG